MDFSKALMYRNPETGKFEPLPVIKGMSNYEIACKYGYTGTEEEYIAEVNKASTEAKEAAAGAKTSETNARTSETNAKASEENAQSSAANASQSVAQAAQSATTATEQSQIAVEKAKELSEAMSEIAKHTTEIAALQEDKQDLLTPGKNIAFTKNLMDQLVISSEGGLDGLDLQTEYNEEEKVWYMVAYDQNGIELSRTPLPGSGGGSGQSVVTFTTSSSRNQEIALPSTSLILDFNWASYETGTQTPTGDGSYNVYVNGELKTGANIQQGAFSIDIIKYLGEGSNTIAVTVTDINSVSKTIRFTIDAIAISVSATLTKLIYEDSGFIFYFTASGSVTKTIHFMMDNTELGTMIISTSGRQSQFSVPQQTHGAHRFMVYATAKIDEADISSNALIYDLIFATSGDTTPIISISLNDYSAEEYISKTIPYTIYDPENYPATITIQSGDSSAETFTGIDRTVHNYTIVPGEKPEEQTYPYNLTTKITCRDVSAEVTIKVSQSSIDVNPTANCSLYYTAVGKSNSKTDRSEWKDKINQLSATLTNFNYVSDGWLKDDEGYSILRVNGGASVRIPFKPYENFLTAGMTLEFEMATSDVHDYEAVILSCYDSSNNTGFKITAQEAQFLSASTNASVPFKEDEHFRISIVIGNSAELKTRLITIYLNGVMSKVVQYPATEYFTQLNPQEITIGSEDCTVDIYNMRVYQFALSRFDILQNWIADTELGAVKKDRYQRNNVYSTSGSAILVSTLQAESDVPIMIIEMPSLPASKDKMTATKITLDADQDDVLRSFESAPVQIAAQGTSSMQYEVKNFKTTYKNGFCVDGSEVAQSAYPMRGEANSIPVSVFVLKADVASCESANNVELVRLYNDYEPTDARIPARIADNRVRSGIDGYPMVLFHNNGKETYFAGKYNFNNDKTPPELYGLVDGDQMFSVEDNTTLFTIFRDIPTTLTEWETSFEAVHPDKDTYMMDDYAKLKELCEWINSTYVKDSDSDEVKEEKLTKFKDEFEEHFNKTSAIYFYMFTELFLMVDSRAKNMYLKYIAEEDRWYIHAYDMDTALGINNQGALEFGYSIEDTDVTGYSLVNTEPYDFQDNYKHYYKFVGGAYVPLSEPETFTTDTYYSQDPVYNGQNSVLWNNVRECFADDITDMFWSMVNGGGYTTDNVLDRFTEHQDKWCEAVWNEDAYYKHLQWFESKNATIYLPMILGKKDLQRNWWYTNRLAFEKSKRVNMNTARDECIRIVPKGGKPYNQLKITPYIDMYVSILFDNTILQERATRNEAVTLTSPFATMNEGYIVIYSPEWIKDIEGIEGFNAKEISLTYATRLVNARIGSATEVNDALDSISFGNNTLLKLVDLRNCTSLGTGTASTIDLSACSSLEEVYLENTALKGITLPNGGIVKVLHLPAGLTSLDLRNLSDLTDFSMEGESSLNSLRIEYTDIGDEAQEIIDNLNYETKPYIRLLGIAWEVAKLTDFAKFLQCRGLDDEGKPLAQAFISGNVNITNAVTLNDFATYQSSFPYVAFKFNEITYSEGTIENLSSTLKKVDADSKITFTNVSWTIDQSSTILRFTNENNAIVGEIVFDSSTELKDIIDLGNKYETCEFTASEYIYKDKEITDTSAIITALNKLAETSKFAFSNVDWTFDDDASLFLRFTNSDNTISGKIHFNNGCELADILSLEEKYGTCEFTTSEYDYITKDISDMTKLESVMTTVKVDSKIDFREVNWELASADTILKLTNDDNNITGSIYFTNATDLNDIISLGQRYVNCSFSSADYVYKNSTLTINSEMKVSTAVELQNKYSDISIIVKNPIYDAIVTSDGYVLETSDNTLISASDEAYQSESDKETWKLFNNEVK